MNAKRPQRLLELMVSCYHSIVSNAILKLTAVPSRGAKRPQILLRASKSSQHSRGSILFTENRKCFPRALRCAKQERQATANTVPKSFQECQATSARHVRRTDAETLAGAKLPAGSRPGKKYDVRCHPLTPIRIRKISTKKVSPLFSRTSSFFLSLSLRFPTKTP